jgi:hypothetical protein
MQGTSDFQHQGSVASSGRPWWKACCVGCLLLIIAFVVGVVIFLRAITGPQNQRLSELPSAYPRDLVPSRMEDAKMIIFTPGKTRGQMMRVISAPIKMLTSVIPSSSLDSDTASRFKAAMDGYSQRMDGLDSVTISWKGLDASKADVVEYYSELFKRRGMTEQSFHDEASATDILLATRKDAGVQVKIVDGPDVPGIDDIEVTVDYITQE